MRTFQLLLLAFSSVDPSIHLRGCLQGGSLVARIAGARTGESLGGCLEVWITGEIPFQRRLAHDRGVVAPFVCHAPGKCARRMRITPWIHALGRVLWLDRAPLSLSSLAPSPSSTTEGAASPPLFGCLRKCRAGVCGAAPAPHIPEQGKCGGGSGVMLWIAEAWLGAAPRGKTGSATTRSSPSTDQIKFLPTSTTARPQPPADSSSHRETGGPRRGRQEAGQG